MAKNDLSPGYITIDYTVSGTNHKHVVPVLGVGFDVSTGTVTITTSDGTPTAAATVVNSYVDALADTCASATTFNFAEVWDKPTPESDPFNAITVSLTQIGGQAGNPAPFTSNTLTFRTNNGTLGKCVWFGPNTSAPKYQRIAGNDGVALPIVTFRDYLLSAASPRVSLGGGRYASPLNWTVKQNDTLLRRAQRRGEI